MIRIPNIVQKIFPATYSFPSQEGKLFLTFDDGPTPDITLQVMNLLSRFQAKATFFCLGENIENFSSIFNEIKSEGHSIGNHSYSHPDAWRTKTSCYLNDIQKANYLIQSNLFRPPYGRLLPFQYFELRKNYRIVLWDVMSYDFSKSTSRVQCIKNVVNNAKDGSIIVFHDTEQAKNNLLFALEFLLEYYSGKGYSFHKI